MLAKKSSMFDRPTFNWYDSEGTEFYLLKYRLRDSFLKSARETSKLSQAQVP